MRNTARRVLVGAGVMIAMLIVAIFGWFVWPTPWVHLGTYTGEGKHLFVPYTYRYELRRNVFTGEFQHRFVGHDWQPTD